MKSHDQIMLESAIGDMLHIIEGAPYDEKLRAGLQETPARVAKAWLYEWCIGYSKSAEDELKVFEDGAENYDEIVLVKDIEFYSHCEHHMAPFFGKAHIGYIPDGRVVGLSKLARVLDVYARRLQVQERITQQTARTIWLKLRPKAVGVVLDAQHHCMCSRGVGKQNSTTVTSKLYGAFAEEPDARAEFFALIRGT